MYESIMSLVLLGLIVWLIVSVVKHKQQPKPTRKCMICGYEGPMKTWMRHYMTPQIIALALLFIGIIPGIIFIGLYWGRHKCPRCGTLGKNIPYTAGDANDAALAT